MGAYLRLLARPGLRSVFLAQLLARAPIGMWPIGMLLLLESRTGSFLVAGSTAGAMTLGRALGTPMASRLVGRFGARWVLGATAAGSALTVVGLVLASAVLAPAQVVWAAGPLSALAGFLTPPAQPVVRALYPELVAPEELGRVFALDASAQEIIFVLGPLAAFGVAAAAGPGWAVLAGAATMLAGTAWLVASPRMPDRAASRRRSRPGAVLRSRAVLTGTAVCLLLVAANSAVEAAVVAAFGDVGMVGGGLLALYSLASLVGGLAFARWTRGAWAPAGWMLLVALGLVATVLAPGWLAGALFVAGLGVAPVFAAVAAAISAGVAQPDAVEAFGWVDTGAIAGASLGFAVAGAAIDAWSVPGGFALSAALALTGAGLAALAAIRPVSHGRTDSASGR